MAEILAAIGGLLWPLLILTVLLVFRKPLRRVLQSAEQREWTIEMGGQRLTMSQLNSQQNELIYDLQQQVGELQANLDRVQQGPPIAADGDSAGELPQPGSTQTHQADPGEPFGLPPTSPPPPAISPGPQQGGEFSYPPPQRPGIGSADSDTGQATDTVVPPAEPYTPVYTALWVDDYPENNALIAAQLSRHGVRVDTATSTREALGYLRQNRYGVIISDMGRVEQGEVVSDAGMRLLRAVRANGTTTPFLIFCSDGARGAFQDEARAAGADAITASPTALSSHLRKLGLL